MAEVLTGRMLMELAWDFQNDDDLAITKESTSNRFAESIATGTGDDQMNQMWRDRRTLTAATGTDDLDLSGTLLNQFGNTVMFAIIKAILVRNRGLPSGATWVEAAGQDLLLGGAGAAGLAFASLFDGNQDAKVRVRSGGFVLAYSPLDGYSVEPGVKDILRVAWDGNLASGSDVEYDIVILGVE